jgi:hypothetical protein
VLQHAHNHRFVGDVAFAHAVCFATDQGFVTLDSVEVTAKPIAAVHHRHVLADKAGHTPRCLVGDAQLALQFLCRHAVPRRGEQVDCVEPKLKRSAGLFERRPDRGMQVVTAPLAGIGPLGLDAIPVRLALT